MVFQSIHQTAYRENSLTLEARNKNSPGYNCSQTSQASYMRQKRALQSIFGHQCHQMLKGNIMGEVIHEEKRKYYSTFNSIVRIVGFKRKGEKKDGKQIDKENDFSQEKKSIYAYNHKIKKDS